MRTSTRVLAVSAMVCAWANVAAAQGRSLTLAEALARAREQAPQIASARLAVDEARARLLGASVRLTSNPEIDASVGNRHGPDSRFTDVEFGIGQAFEPQARRSARVAAANAAIAQSTANVDEITRSVLRETAAAYYRAVHASDRIKLLDAAYALASSVHSAADRRFKAGDIAILDVNIAKSAMARVRADREGAEAAKALALGELRQLLRIESDIGVDGTLSPPSEMDLNSALQSATDRPELRALEAGIQDAEAEVRLGASLAKPEYGVGVRYARDEGDHVILGGMTLTLPMFSKGQEQRAAGSARAARLRNELDAAKMRVQIEVRTAVDAYMRRLAAVRVLEADAIPGLDENERLTARSFDVGQLGLPELLLIRREILETRFQYLEALLEAALARVDVDASAARLR